MGSAGPGRSSFLSGGSHQQREEADGSDLLPLYREHDGLLQGAAGMVDVFLVNVEMVEMV